MDIIKYFERNYRHLMLCTVMMIKDVDRAQDILHNVAVTLLTKQDELRDLRHPGAYVTQCIYRATLNYLRKESRSAAHDPVILSIMESLGLNPRDKRACKKYSLGMLQKLGIAAALMENPDLVLLDEPTNNVDSESVEMILNLLIRYKKAGTTILLTSHHRDEIDRIADTIYYIDKGRIHRE